MQVVEGQDAVVDCQEAEEPGGTDQQKEQKGATKGPAAGTWEDTGHARVMRGSCRGHRRTHGSHGRRGIHTGTWRSQEDTRGDERSQKEPGTQRALRGHGENRKWGMEENMEDRWEHEQRAK